MESLLEQADVARQKGRQWRKIRDTIFLAIVSVFVIWVGIRYYFPFSEGIKTGKLNYVVYKGLVFKTYEGELILSGMKPSESGGIQSGEFVFSVAQKDVAEELMHAGGKIVELHYTEYFGAIPWRGSSRYVVDDIVTVSDGHKTPEADEPGGK
jgi:hypothetical protein